MKIEIEVTEDELRDVLAWYVAPDYESIEYGYQPNDGDRLYAVPPNAEVSGSPKRSVGEPA